MTIYKVIEHVQASDVDSWQHWIGEKICSYHLSKEGADAKVQELLGVKLSLIPKLMELNPHIVEKYPEHYIQEAEEIRNNVQHFAVGNNGNGSESAPIYFIRSIEVLP